MRRLLISLFVAICAAAVMLPGFATSISSSESSAATKMYQTTRARLAIARARGDRYFGALVAAEAGHTVQVAAAITAAGGHVDYEADDVGYLRTRIPLDAVESIAERPDVSAVDADAPITVLLPPGPTSLQPVMHTGPGAPAPNASPTHKPRTAADEGPILHPYRPQTDMGLDALRRAHPLFDGRGVTVALMDPGPDFLLPELQHAKTLDGRVVPKFVDIRVGAPSNSTDAPSIWLPVTANVNAVNGTFTYKGVTYKVPHDGDFRLLFAPNSGWYALIAQLLDPKKKLADNVSVFAILWDASTNTVWVDTDRDNDFSDERALTDYAVHHDYGIFHIPTDDADARGTIGFVVQTAPEARKLALVFGTQLHATMTAGTIAGNEDDGGRVMGIAPEAQILSIDEGGSDSSVIESAIWAERNPRVDLLCFEIISAESYGLKDGRFIESIIFDRLIRKYGKPIMYPADNDFGMSRVEETCDVPTVTCVGAYESRASYLINSGYLVPYRDNLHWVDSFGPAGNGALVPSFLAPSGWVITGPGYKASPSFDVVKGLFDLPPGYMIGGGTSQATPTATGAVAVLIGAAREMHLQISNQRVLDALKRTARYISHVPAYQQGTGLLQVDGAYNWLRRWSGKELPSIAFDAPVRTVDSFLLATPNRGVGFFEREGWVAGARSSRTITLERLTGTSNAQRFTLQLVGNDGTFVLPPNIVLPLGARVPVHFIVAPATSGAHSAILRVRSADGEIAGQTLMTVVAGEQFRSTAGYTIANRIEVPHPGPTSVFVRVPSGTQALVVRTKSSHKFLLTAYEGDGGNPLNRSNNLLASAVADVGVSQMVFRFPRPGTWELQLIDYNDQNDTGKVIVSHTVPVDLTAYLVNLSVQRTGAGGLLMMQTAAHLFGLSTTQTLAHRASYTGTIARGAQRVYDITVPSGATGIAATLTASNGNSPDLYLLDCTHGPCLLREKSTSWGNLHQLYYDAPAVGRWRLIVDGYGVRTSAGYTLQTHVLDPFAAPGQSVVQAITASLPADDPSIYYNECPPGKCGELPQRKGLNPTIFNVYVP